MAGRIESDACLSPTASDKFRYFFLPSLVGGWVAGRIEMPYLVGVEAEAEFGSLAVSLLSSTSILHPSLHV